MIQWGPDMNQSESRMGYQLSKTYPVSPERLFGALTNPAVLQRIWGVQHIVVDARVGGTTSAVYVEGGQDWSFTITYLEVVPNTRLRWITHFKSFPTKETRVAVLFNEADTGTELIIRMDNFETSEERDANREAWERGLSTLAAIV